MLKKERKTIKEELNQILKDYGLVEGEPLEIDVVDKILNLFKEKLEGLKEPLWKRCDDYGWEREGSIGRALNDEMCHYANLLYQDFNEKIDKLIEELA